MTDKEELKRRVERVLEKYMKHTDNPKVVASAIMRQAIEPTSASAAVVETPTEDMCGAARGFILGIHMDVNSYEDMIEHMQMYGDEIPDWLKDRKGNLTKWDQAECIWLLMESKK